LPPCGQLMRVNPLGDGARGFAGSVTGVAQRGTYSHSRLWGQDQGWWHVSCGSIAYG